MYYVLTCDDSVRDGYPIGVFDSPKIDDSVIREYFGDFETRQIIDIRDSGIEWQKTIMSNGVCQKITLYYFMLNEI